MTEPRRSSYTRRQPDAVPPAEKRTDPILGEPVEIVRLRVQLEILADVLDMVAARLRGMSR